MRMNLHNKVDVGKHLCKTCPKTQGKLDCARTMSEKGNKMEKTTAQNVEAGEINLINYQFCPHAKDVHPLLFRSDPFWTVTVLGMASLGQHFRFSVNTLTIEHTPVNRHLASGLGVVAKALGSKCDVQGLGQLKFADRFKQLAES